MQKQCKQMFEQMKPSKEVVDRLYERIAVEEQSVSSKTIQKQDTVQKTIVSVKKDFSWGKLFGSIIACTCLLGISVIIGVQTNWFGNKIPNTEAHISNTQTTQFLQSDDTTWNLQTEAERYNELLYDEQYWNRTIPITDTDMLEEQVPQWQRGYLMGEDEKNMTHRSELVPVYHVQINGIKNPYAVAVELDGIYYSMDLI